MGLFPYHFAVTILMVMNHDHPKDTKTQLLYAGLSYAVDEARRDYRPFVFLSPFYWERVLAMNMLDVFHRAKEIAVLEMSKHGEMV